MKFRTDHDLSLGNIGPYSRRMLGASMITDRPSGRMVHFPLTLTLDGKTRFPAEPDEEGERRWIMAEADAGLTLFTQRHFLTGARDVFCDARYVPAGDDALVCVLGFRNDSARDHSATVEQGLVREFAAPVADFFLPEGSVKIEAEDYHRLSAYHQYGADGERACVRRMLFASGGRALEGRFGEWPGDTAEYRFSSPRDFRDARLYLRYIKAHDNAQAYILALDNRGFRVSFSRTADRYGAFHGWKILEIPVGKLEKGRHRLTLKVLEPQNRFFKKQYERNLYTFPSGADIEKRTEFGLDFFLFCEGKQDPSGWAKRAGEPPFTHVVDGPCAVAEDGGLPRGGCFAFGAAGGAQGEFAFSEERLVFTEVPEHQYLRLAPAGPSAPAEDVAIAPRLTLKLPLIPLPARSQREVMTVAVRARGHAEAVLKWRQLERNAKGVAERAAAEFEKRKFRVHDGETGPSVFHMMNYALTNVSFPSRIIDRNVLGVCPSKFHFNMLYQWDAGMTAVAQSQYAFQLCADNILQYSSEGDPERGFIQHGTALPTHIYALWELFLSTGNPAVLENLYGPMRHAYGYYVGRHPASAMMRNRDGFINPTHLWYNCIGMDDYPVQKHLAENNLLTHAAMPETNASAIRFAKILRFCAHVIGKKADVRQYDRDIRRLSAPLDRLWHEKSGYYCWLERGKKVLHESGWNFNCGISGVYPLISGLKDGNRAARLVGHLKNPSEMWSPIGISTVDQSAPYYSPDGYWNGRVWIPHQWMIWKALLGLGETGFAEKVARTALEVFTRNEKKHAMCFENYVIRDGEGSGVVHMSALTAPVINFYCAYFRPGRVSTGFDARLVKRKERDGKISLFFESPFLDEHVEGAVIVLEPSTAYRVNGTEIKSTESGSLSLIFKIDKEAVVEIRKV